MNPGDETKSKETETEILRRVTTPRELLWVRYYVFVGVPTVIAIKLGMHIVCQYYGWTTVWLDFAADVFNAFGIALGGFMDRIWGRMKEERTGTTIT